MPSLHPPPQIYRSDAFAYKHDPQILFSWRMSTRHLSITELSAGVIEFWYKPNIDCLSIEFENLVFSGMCPHLGYRFLLCLHSPHLEMAIISSLSQDSWYLPFTIPPSWLEMAIISRIFLFLPHPTLSRIESDSYHFSTLFGLLPSPCRCLPSRVCPSEKCRGGRSAGGGARRDGGEHETTSWPLPQALLGTPLCLCPRL